MDEHLSHCLTCQGKAHELAHLSRALAQLAPVEPRADLKARTLAAVQGRVWAPQSHWAPWAGLLAAGMALALVLASWVLIDAVTAFRNAGGAEFLGLISSYPHLLLRYPQETTLAVLEALPIANVVLGLASTVLACFLGTQLLARMPVDGIWPRLHGRV